MNRVLETIQIDLRAHALFTALGTLSGIAVLVLMIFIGLHKSAAARIFWSSFHVRNGKYLLSGFKSCIKTFKIRGENDPKNMYNHDDCSSFFNVFISANKNRDREIE
jgi:hypothetical protein